MTEKKCIPEDIKKQRSHDYYVKNKSKLREKIKCDCGKMVIKTYMKEHKTKLIHLLLMNYNLTPSATKSDS